MDKIVSLNIGGIFYTTTRETLARYGDNFFTALMSGNIPPILDEAGRYFVDRDGQFFAPILTFFRTDEIDIPSGMSIRGVLREAKYYIAPQIFIDRLESVLEQNSPSLTDQFIEQEMAKHNFPIYLRLKLEITSRYMEQLSHKVPRKEDLNFFIFRTKEDERELLKDVFFCGWCGR